MKNQQSILYIISIVIFISYLIVNIYYLYISRKKLNRMLIDYYSEKKMKIIYILNLNFKERLRYGVPIFSFLKIYQYYFALFTLKINYVKKIEMIDNNKNEYTKYVEILIKNKKIVDINEFQTYNI